MVELTGEVTATGGYMMSVEHKRRLDHEREMQAIQDEFAALKQRVSDLEAQCERQDDRIAELESIRK